jgi:hypothetical protein
MAITFDNARQERISGHKAFKFTDLTTGVYVGLIKVPVNAIVTDARLVITTLFDSVTTDKFSIGSQLNGSAAVDTTYAAQSADVTAVPTQILGVMTGAINTVAGTVGVRWDGAGGGTANGAGTLYIEYIIDGRADEVQP